MMRPAEHATPQRTADAATLQVQEALRSIPVHEAPGAGRLEFRPKPQFAHLAEDKAMTSCRNKRIGILVVTFNALGTLRSVLQRIPPLVWENVEEVVIFDDASPDATFELGLGIKMLLGSPKLHVLRNASNLGYGGNQKAGYRYFIEKGFDICVLLHGDGQYAPEMLAHLYHPIVAGEAEAVFGSRMMAEFGGPLQGGMPLYKYAGNRILTAYENAALGMNLTEFHSGYRAYDLHALRKIHFDRMTDDFHFDTEIIIKLHHQAARILEIPIPTYYGSELCYVNGLRYAADVYRTVRRYRRTLSGRERAPEFAEFAVHYPLKSLPGSSHEQALSLLPEGAEVLDVGCGEGYFAELLRAQGCRVTGIDMLAVPARRDAMAAYHQMDLDRADLSLLKGRFDYILLMDILEHLREPERLLRDLRGLLKPSGKLVVSVPNVANVTVRAGLLMGRFDYTPRGILDATHLRFFTRKTMRAMARNCGFRAVREMMTPMPVELALGWKPHSLLLRLLSAATRLMPGLMGYQIMSVLVPEPDVE